MIFEKKCHCLHCESNLFFKILNGRYCWYAVTLPALVSKAGGLCFKSCADKVEQSVANGSRPLRHFFKRSCVARKYNDADISRATRYMFRRSLASTILEKFDLNGITERFKKILTASSSFSFHNRYFKPS